MLIYFFNIYIDYFNKTFTEHSFGNIYKLWDIEMCRLNLGIIFATYSTVYTISWITQTFYKKKYGFNYKMER
jgi:hypothetical protein